MYIICDLLKIICIVSVLGILLPSLVVIYSNSKLNN